MKTISINYLRERIKNAHPRTRKAQLNTLLGLIIKGGGMLISLLLVPLTIDYLSNDTYGTWLTISSVVTMLTFLDIGIGNGLRNKFSEAIANEDTMLARAYVSTSYTVFGAVQILFIFAFLLILRFIPLQRMFNTQIDIQQLQTVLLLTVIAMVIKLVLDILSYILFALQESSRASLMTFLSNALILIGTFVLTRFTTGNLVYLAAVTAFSPIVVLFIGGIVLYAGRLKKYRPSFRLANLKYTKSLLSLGYKFFIIQIAVVVIFYTDNIIITQLFGASEVTTYNVAFRYFNAASTIFAIAITPYWSAFTEAYTKGDTTWMEQSYLYLKKLWVGITLVIILMIVMADIMYKFWIADRVHVPLDLSIFMGLSVIITCWNNVTVSVINGTGKIKMQFYFAIIAALINVPLAIFFSKYFHLGSTGVIIATCVSLLIGSFLGAVQARKIINNKASGLWAN